MRRVMLVAVIGLVAGCGGSSPPAPTRPTDPKPVSDPIIRVKENIGGEVGPVGATRGREYEGPVSKAPDWVKKQLGGK